MTVVYVGAPWCAPCRTLKPVVERACVEHGHVLDAYDLLTRLPPAGFQPTQVPALYLVDKGSIIKRHTGAMSAGQLNLWLRSHE